MQDCEQSQLEFPQRFILGYNWVDSIGGNQITEKGYHYLSKAEWSLEWIDIGTYFNTQRLEQNRR